MGEKVLIALGGNALQRAKGSGTIEEQLEAVRETCKIACKLIEAGHTIAITHGNGPQVGSILLRNELASSVFPPKPLDVCSAESQGMIGYMLQNTMFNELDKKYRKYPVITILTQTLVDKNDPAFQNPTKPIGTFYSKEEAEKLKAEKGWQIVEQPGKGFRRVVPSPRPIKVIEGQAIKKLFDEEWIVISCGGGGIPVIEENDNLKGVEAVIDKDRTAAILGKTIGVDVLLILTDVEKAYINFLKPNQQALDKLTIKEAEKLIEDGQFGKGSMGPKVEACMDFVKSGGKKAIITSLDKCRDALEGKTGTHFVK